MEREAARYEHDCKDCKFLGWFGSYDLYFHPSDMEGLRTVVARFGREGDYFSGLYSTRFESLIEAERRAVARKLIAPRTDERLTQA